MSATQGISRRKAAFCRGLALLLAMALTMSLMACGSQEAGENDQASVVYAPLGDKVYVPEQIDLPYNLNTVTGALLSADGETMYLTDGEIEQAEYESNGFIFHISRSRYRLLCAALGGALAEELRAYQPPEIPEGACGSVSMSILCDGGDGTLWVREGVNYYYIDLPDTYDPIRESFRDYQSEPESYSFCRQLDGDGNELRRVDHMAVMEELGIDTEAEFFTYGMTFDADGNLYITANDTLYVLDPNLSLLFTLEGMYMDRDIVTLSDGHKAVKVFVDGGLGGDSGYELRAIDLAAKGWGEGYRLSGSVYGIYDGGNGFLFCYNDGSSLCGWEVATGQPQKLFSWFDTGLNSTIRYMRFLADGRLLLMTQGSDWDRDSNGNIPTVLSALTAVDRAEAGLTEKTVLTLGTYRLNWDMRKLIQRFNASSDQYAIQVRDYTELAGGDQLAGRTLMITEMTAGKIPDLLDTYVMPLRQLGNKGYLEDLWVWIENDPDIGRENVMERVFDAASQDGKLYEVFSHFTIKTIAAAADVVGDRMSWTLADMLAVEETLPEGCTLFNPGASTKSYQLRTMMAMNADSFIDWNTGTCDFESDAFKDILAYCNLFPQAFGEYDYRDQFDDTYSRVYVGQQLLFTGTLYDWQGGGPQLAMALCRGDISYVGYPTADGSCGSYFDVDGMHTALAMSTACADKEGAWSFIRQLLVPQYAGRSVNYDTFPTNKPDFDFLAEKYMIPEYDTFPDGTVKVDKDGNPREKTLTYGAGIVDYEVHATTQKEYDQVMALYNSIDKMYTYDTTLYGIIEDMAGAYFAGDRSLDETARLIQSRVTIYVNENR